jgi:hypothetical protein
MRLVDKLPVATTSERAFNHAAIFTLIGIAVYPYSSELTVLAAVSGSPFIAQGGIEMLLDLRTYFHDIRGRNRVGSLKKINY